MMNDTIYDLCIVGAGMYGSAAARHASSMEGVKVCLVGPDEPTREEMRDREIFGCHYDEGRMTRVLDSDIPSQILSKESISRHRELEKLSGIRFYHPVGYMCIPKKNSSYLKQVLEWAENLTIVDLSDRDTFKKRFPFIELTEVNHPLLDEIGGGHISARNLVSAQKKVAASQGCDIIPEVVNEVKPLAEDDTHEIITEGGKVIKSKRVLLCPGAFINFKQFPMPKLKVYLKKETVVFFKLPLQEVKRLSTMPSMAFRHTDEKTGAYILPPIKYPDGNYYLKIGHLDYQGTAEHVKNLEEMKKWYLSEGDPVKISYLSKFLIDMLPGLIYEDISSSTCVTSTTPSKLPYIDRVSATVTVAAVGSTGAKISDEVGRIAAVLSLTGRWDSETNKSDFGIVLDEDQLE